MAHPVSRKASSSEGPPSSRSPQCQKVFSQHPELQIGPSGPGRAAGGPLVGEGDAVGLRSSCSRHRETANDHRLKLPLDQLVVFQQPHVGKERWPGSQVVIFCHKWFK